MFGKGSEMKRKRIWRTVTLTVTSVTINGTAALWRNYAVQVWEKNVFRKWLYNFLNVLYSMVDWFKKYLAGVRVALKYRMYYQAVTKPMKHSYKQLRKKKGRSHI